MFHWWLLIYSVSIFVIGVTTTIVAWFWIVYLIETARRKWKIYKHALNCIEQGGEDGDEYQISAYNAQTEVVKMLFLFFMNLLEWVAMLASCTGGLSKFLEEYLQLEEKQSNSHNVSEVSNGFLYTPGKINFKFSIVHVCFFLANSCLVMCINLGSCLLMYLAARQARKSWITTKKLPYLVTFSFLSLTITQVLALFCTIHIIACCINIFLLLISILIAIKQYRKLLLVIEWSIVDLSISQNNILLVKQQRMKRKFIKLFNILLFAIILFTISQIIWSIYLASVLVFRESNSTMFFSSLCEISHFPNSEQYYYSIILTWISFCVGFIGMLFVLIPYIGYGFSMMFVILFRLYKGKTGFKTHFPNTSNLTFRLI